MGDRLFREIESNKAAFRTLQEIGYVRYDDLPLLAKDGRQIEVEFVSNICEDGEARVVQCNIRDNSQRKRAEESLHESEARFRSAFEDSNVAIVLTGTDYRFVRANAAFARLFGYTREEMPGLSMADVTHPDDIAESDSRREPLARGETHSFRIEKRYLHKNGNVFWGLTHVSVVRDPSAVPCNTWRRCKILPTASKRRGSGTNCSRGYASRSTDCLWPTCSAAMTSATPIGTRRPNASSASPKKKSSARAPST